MKTTRTFGRSRQRGAGIVETMIGILIGLLVVLAVYNVFAVAEGYKRTAVGAADAQTTGLYAQFVLNREISNAGNGIMSGMKDLLNCADVNLKPIPVLITDGGGNNVSDSMIVTYSTASRVVWPVDFVGGSGPYPRMAGTSDPFFVQSPNGFKQNDRVIAMDNVPNGRCEMTTVTNAPVPDANGVISISHPATGSLYLPDLPAQLLNMGQVGQATRTLYDVAGGQLRMTDLFVAGAAANPIAQNVVLLKAQYGVDCNNNGVISWTSATASNVCGDPIPAVGTTAAVNYTPADLQAYDLTRLVRIRAIRVGIVVRSDEPDLRDTALTGQTAVLFDCSTHNTACQGRVALTSAVLTDGYRFRTYEIVIPMRNAIWNNT
jgi:type IV pilus assembly protein PilW